jgi:hypothetical protein
VRDAQPAALGVLHAAFVHALVRTAVLLAFLVRSRAVQTPGKVALSTARLL